MNKEELQAVKKLYSKLRKSLEPGSVAAELFSKGVLTEEQYHDTLPSLTTTGEKNDFILKCVMKCGRLGIFAIFVQCIEDADPALGYLAEDLRGGTYMYTRRSIHPPSGALICMSHKICSYQNPFPYGHFLTTNFIHLGVRGSPA